MTGISAWLDLMTQTATIEPPSGRDRFNNRTYGASVSYTCRVVGQQRRVVNAAGQEVTSYQTVYLGSPDAVDPDARITLSTADVGSTSPLLTQPPIVATGRYPDESGQHHSVVYLGRRSA